MYSFLRFFIRLLSFTLVGIALSTTQVHAAKNFSTSTPKHVRSYNKRDGTHIDSYWRANYGQKKREQSIWGY